MFEKTPSYAPNHPSTSFLLSFLSRCFRDPWRTGAVAPSSRALAVAMARQVLPYESGTIIELGPGTGAITAALLDFGIAPDRLYLVERSSEFASVLRMRFPSIRVVEGDALNLREYTERDGVKDAAAIVSGLPLRFFDRKARTSLLLRSFNVMGDSGSFVQFTYNHRPPIPTPVVARLGLEARNLGFVWSNLPPASIWKFQRAKSSNAAVDSDFQRPARLLGHGVEAGGPALLSAQRQVMGGRKSLLQWLTFTVLLIAGAPTMAESLPTFFGHSSQFIELTPKGPPSAVAFLDETGAVRRLSEFRSKSIVLNIWATWCPPCVYEMPALARLAAGPVHRLREAPRPAAVRSARWWTDRGARDAPPPARGIKD